MQSVYRVTALPDWEIDGVKYQSKLAMDRPSHPDLDDSVCLPIGVPITLPAKGGRALALALHARAKSKDNPAMQRHKIECVQVPEPSDHPLAGLEGIPHFDAEGRPIVEAAPAGSIPLTRAELAELERKIREDERHKVLEEMTAPAPAPAGPEPTAKSE